MARETQRLNARSVASAKPGKYADGGGLYLIVDQGGAKRWQFHFRLGGKSRREMGLGGVSSLSLAEARDRANDARKLVAAGLDPINARKETERAKAADQTTFGTFCDQVLPTLLSSSRNEKHIWQWGTTLRGFAASLKDLPVGQIDTNDVLAVLQRQVTIKGADGQEKRGTLWQMKAETASRLRGRIERILDAAKAKGLRDGENPARWRGHLDSLLPPRQRLTRGHHPAMPYADVPTFLARLRRSTGSGATALEFLILTAARSGEVMGARWQEIDFDAAVWTVPAVRMKAGREHRVPLGPAAMAILTKLYESRRGEIIFAGTGRRSIGAAKRQVRDPSPISNATMMKALRTAGANDFTVHGFRSSFRDWAGEETSFPENIAEAALAHTVGDAVERAYRRGDALAKRRKLMEAWEGYCLAPPRGNIIRLAR